MPGLLKVAWNVRVPAVRVASAGSTAAESLLVKCSVSVNPVTTLPYASRAVTVKLPETPCVIGLGNPASASVVAGPAATVTVKTAGDEMTPSESVTLTLSW